MDTETLRMLIRAAVLAAPLAAPLGACGGDEAPAAPAAPTAPAAPVSNVGPALVPLPPPRERPFGVDETADSQGPASPAELPSPEEPDDPAEGPYPEELDLPEELQFDPDYTGPRPVRIRRGSGTRHPPGVMEGRPLMSASSPVRATLRAGAGWSTGAPVTSRPRAAARWLDSALAEHASVASFARAVCELSALGAPADLLEGHLAAGLDEVAHARACFDVAARLGAPARAPGPMPVPPPRAADLTRLAVDTFLEGCVNETAAALGAARAAAACRDAFARGVLEVLAEDEARHAALAWQTVRWAVGACPEARAALHGVALPHPEGGTRDPELGAWGVLCDYERRRAVRDASARIVTPLRDELLG